MLHRIVRRVARIGKQPEPVKQPVFLLHVDTPAHGAQATRSIAVGGWLVPQDETSVVAVRIVNGGRTYKVRYGINRPDVAAALPALDQAQTLPSGFTAALKFEDGPLDIEVDFGEGFEVVHTVNMRYSAEQLTEMLYNPNLSAYWAEHQNLLTNKKMIYHEARRDAEFVSHPDDPKLVAFYLPQFHPIKENDEVWGKGFTEWTNVTTAKPRFVGHQQPVLPADLGFYDLRLDDTIADQIRLAKKHGIYAFCFYYYWFSGKRLLETPLDTFLRHKEWDFNFAICWANENWTKRWDGRDDDVIIAQEYNDDDPLKFIKDVEPILLDPRYMREDDKPVLVVYRASALKVPDRYAEVWRKYFLDRHQLELHIVSVMGFDINDPRDYGFDAGLEFMPLTAVVKKSVFKDGELPMAEVQGKVLDVDYEGGIVDYRQVSRHPALRKPYPFPAHRSVMPSWDNEARKKGKGASFHNVSPDLYAQWLDAILALETDQKAAPFVYINAWNEWAEGAVLEPTQHYGHAMLNRTSEVLARYSADSINRQRFAPYGISRSQSTKLAVVVHAFYVDGWPAIRKRLGYLDGDNFDLFVTLNQKDEAFGDVIKRHYPAVTIVIAPNRGRDILPFLSLAHRLSAAGYEYLLKLHTKKSTHRSDGSDWFEGLLEELLPNKKIVKQIIEKLASGVALIGPQDHYVSLERYIGSNLPALTNLASLMNGNPHDLEAGLSSYGYFAGSMFWLRLDCLGPLLDCYLLPEDFEAEAGQIDGTLAHAVERLIGVLPVLQEATTYGCGPNGLQLLDATAAQTNYTYAP